MLTLSRGQAAPLCTHPLGAAKAISGLHQSVAVFYDDAAACSFDDALGLEHLQCAGDAGPAHAQRQGDEFVRKSQLVTVHPILRHEQPARQSFLDVTACAFARPSTHQASEASAGSVGGRRDQPCGNCAADRHDTGNRIRHRLVAPRHDSRQQGSTVGGKLAAVFWQQLPLHYGIGGILIPGVAD